MNLKKTIMNRQTNYFSFLMLLSIIILGACKDDDNVSPSDCDGEMCVATIGANETAATIPASLHGTHNMVLSHAESNSPIELGTKATFTLSANTIVVSIEGMDCFSVQNAFSPAGSTNYYLFKAECVGDMAFGVSGNTDGSMNEINLSKADGTGFLGQFTLE